MCNADVRILGFSGHFKIGLIICCESKQFHLHAGSS